MSKVYFKHCIIPCVDNEVTRWHVAHGWIWDVVECSSCRKIGVFFVTLLCGDGGIIHFYKAPGITLDGTTVLSAFRRGIGLAAANCNVVYATVPVVNSKLIRCLKCLDFVECSNGGFFREAAEIKLLKYLPPPK